MNPGSMRLPQRETKPFDPDSSFHRVALRGAAPVVPQDRRADRRRRRVQGDQTVHLTGEADALDGVSGDAGGATCLVDRLDGARPPIVGGLLRPTRSRGGRRVASAASRDDLALLIEENGLGAAGTNVDADEEAHAVDGTGASSTE